MQTIISGKDQKRSSLGFFPFSLVYNFIKVISKTRQGTLAVALC